MAIPGMVHIPCSGVSARNPVLASMWSAAMPGGKGKQTTSISPRAWANAWAPQLGWRQLPQPDTRGHSNNSGRKGSGNRGSSAPRRVGKDDRGRENQSKVGKNSKPEPETHKPTSRGVDYAEPRGPKGQTGKGERRQERRERHQQAKPCGGDNDGGGESGPDQTDGRSRRGALKKVGAGKVGLLGRPGQEKIEEQILLSKYKSLQEFEKVKSMGNSKSGSSRK